MGDRCRWVYDKHVPGGKFLVPGCMNRANGEPDFADLLKCFRNAYALEARDSEETRDAAYGMLDEAKRLVERFEQSADYLDDLAGYERDYARAGA